MVGKIPFIGNLETSTDDARGQVAGANKTGRAKSRSGTKMNTVSIWSRMSLNEGEIHAAIGGGVLA